MAQPTPVTRSRLPIIAIAVWAVILTAIIAMGLLFSGRGATNGNDTRLGAAGAPGAAAINLSAPLAADPSASPIAGASSAPGTTTDNDGGRKGPGGFGFGPGRFGHGGPGRGHGPISITAISGSQLSLKTDDGWTRTIDATGATITEQAGGTITLGALTVGDQIGFRETRNSDGTYKITDIARIPPQAGGTVKSVDANSATLTEPDGTTKTIGLTSGTTYTMDGKAATAADLKIGTRVHAVGTVDAGGTFTATMVEIAPAEVGGIVTAKTADTITIKDRSGASITIHVDGSTTYRARSNSSASLADVAVGDVLEALGALNSDGSLNGSTVRFGTAGPGGFGGPGRGPGGFGGPGKGGHGGRFHDAGHPGNSNGAPAASPNAG